MFDMLQKFMNYILVAIFIMSMTSSTVIYYLVNGVENNIDLFLCIFMITLAINALTVIVFMSIIAK